MGATALTSLNMGVTYWFPNAGRRAGIWGSGSKLEFKAWVHSLNSWVHSLNSWLRVFKKGFKLLESFFFSDMMSNDQEKDPRVYVSRLYYSGGASVALFAFRRDEFGGFMPMAGIIQRHKLKTSGNCGYKS